MKKALTLSLIIPVYNEEHYLGACLDAVAAQTVMPDEVIVVDNNSTDKSVEIAKRYPFVRLLRVKKQGVVYARNKGFDAAKSELIARIDADTHLPTNWVRTCSSLIKDVAAVTGPVAYFDMPGPRRNYWIDHTIRDRLYQRAPYAPFLFGSNMVIRASAWRAVRGEVCESGVHEDLDLAIHLMEHDYRILYDKKLLASTSSRRYEDHLKSFLHYMQIYRDTYTKHGIMSRAPRVATSVYTVGYALLRPIRPAYDPERRVWRVGRLLRNKRELPRSHPFS